MAWAFNIYSKFTRRKIINSDQLEDTKLNRVLNVFDLSMLGIGSTLGVGIYVLSGSVARTAGPAVVLSFLVAAVASVFSGLCYAEFGSRVPKAGSAYVYSYVSIGELVAFIIGWNLIMEYMIGVSSVARGYSRYVDSMFGNAMQKAFTQIAPIDVPYLSHYVDFFAFGITILLTLLLSFGVKKSSMYMNVFTGLKVIVSLFVIGAGCWVGDVHNWNLSPSEIDLNQTDPHKPGHLINVGDGGFAPFGFSHIMEGAATCFFAFVGFDSIATTGEEARNPQRNIPIAIIISLSIILCIYLGIASILTMMVPYYLQDPEAPIAFAFAYVNWEWAKWVVTIGALFGLSTTLLGTMFPLPRVLYAMASDGVLPSFLAKIHPKFKTPFIATLLAGSLAAILASLVDLEVLIEMMSIGTLAAYSLVSICVLILRYRKVTKSVASFDDYDLTLKNYLLQTVNWHKSTVPTRLSSKCSKWTVVAFCIFSICFSAVAIFSENSIREGDKIQLTLLGIFLTLMILSLFSLKLQPVPDTKLTFKVPLVPLIPGLSIVSNIYLIMKLNHHTWIRFSVWMTLGFIIYGYCTFSGTSDRAYYRDLRKDPNELTNGGNCSNKYDLDLDSVDHHKTKKLEISP